MAVLNQVLVTSVTGPNVPVGHGFCVPGGVCVYRAFYQCFGLRSQMALNYIFNDLYQCVMQITLNVFV